MAIEKENRFNIASLRRPTTWCAVVVLGAAASSSQAQSPRPEPLPASAVSLAGFSGDEDLGGLAFEDTFVPVRNGPRRRPAESDKVIFGFRAAPIDELVPFIVQTTGKVVMPVRLTTLKNTKITLVTDEPLEPSRALDLLFESLRLHGVGVVETDDVIILDQLDNIGKSGALPVLSADEDVLGRTDRASMVIKIFRAVNTEASGIGDRILETFPDYATLTVDPNSNQIVVLGDIGLCQQVQKLINELDNTYVVPRTRTFRLKYADANEIAQNITELFEQDSSPARTTPARSRRQQQTGRRSSSSSTRRLTSTGGVGPTVELRLTVNVQQNAVTVQAEPAVIEEITELVENHWDLPRSPRTSKLYALKYTDPLKVRDLLQALLGGGSGGAAQGGQRRGSGTSRARSGIEQMVGGIYTIEAYPDSNSLIVLCKTEFSFDFLDDLIDSLDQPSDIGLPMLIELKHANAVTLAELLNIQLADGGGGGMSIPDQGLRGREGGDTDGATGGGGREGTGPAGTMTFPWQNGRAREDQTPESSLIGKVRIVPVVRQNALSILAPPAHREALRELVEYYDRPGRQVMISVIIAEVALSDALSLGLRLSSFDIDSPERPDNAILGTGAFSVTDEGGLLSRLFDTAVLSANFNINVFFQALAQNNRVRILQEPRIFTADNQEANFFDGRDVPFITNTTINSLGNPTDSFEYREVGVSLNVRPRITANRHVDMEINLELSTISDERLFGGAILDRRETTTRVVVKHGQTIVLSGILRDEESEIIRKVPFLGDIPLLGLLFQSRETETVRSELIAFITPYVVDNPDENDTNFNEAERQRLKDLSRPLKEQDDLLDNDRTRKRILPEPVEPASRQLLEPDELTDA